MRNLICGTTRWWLLWESRRELETVTKQDYRREKMPRRSNEGGNMSQKGWVTSHSHSLEGNSLSRGIRRVSEAPTAACCPRQVSGLGGSGTWSTAAQMPHTWSASWAGRWDSNTRATDISVSTRRNQCSLISPLLPPAFVSTDGKGLVFFIHHSDWTQYTVLLICLRKSQKQGRHVLGLSCHM